MPGALGRSGMGDIMSDLTTVASSYAAYKDAGTLGPWLSERLTTFRALPRAVTLLRQQVDGIRKVYGENNQQVTALAEADAELVRIQHDYPDVAQRVNALTLAIAPVAGKLAAGTYDAEVIAVLAGSGLNIMGTIYRVNDLISAREQAERRIQDAVTDPNVPLTVRQQAMQALSSMGGTDWLKLSVVGLIGFVVIRAMLKR